MKLFWADLIAGIFAGVNVGFYAYDQRFWWNAGVAAFMFYGLLARMASR